VPKLTTVTVGTDGNIDYVETPDGVKYALGTTSVLQLIAKMVSGQRLRKEAVETFNKDGAAMVVLDLDAFFEMLTPVRKRWASNSSLFRDADRDDPLRGTPMDKAEFIKRLACCEQQVKKLTDTPSPEATSALVQAVASISLPSFGDPSKNNSFMSLGQPKLDTVEDPGAYTPPTSVTHPLGKSANFQTLQTNLKMAEEIVEKVDQTDTKIDALVTAGRKFNASQARSDLHTIVATLVSMLKQVDPAQPWVTAELQKLANQATEIHGLFAPAKV